jgi:hypothetical protein
MDAILQNIYFNVSHPASFSSVERLYKAARTTRPAITRDYVRKWLSEHDTYTLHRHARQKFKRSRLISPGLFMQADIDLAVSNLSKSSLFRDNVWVEKVKQCIKETLSKYSTGGEVDIENIEDSLDNTVFTVNDQLLLETLLMDIRGMTIPYCSWKKKQQKKREDDLYQELNNLEVNFSGGTINRRID